MLQQLQHGFKEEPLDTQPSREVHSHLDPPETNKQFLTDTFFLSYRNRHVCVVNLIDAVPQIFGEIVLPSWLMKSASAAGATVLVIVVVTSQNITVSA